MCDCNKTYTTKVDATAGSASTLTSTDGITWSGSTTVGTAGTYTLKFNPNFTTTTETVTNTTGCGCGGKLKKAEDEKEDKKDGKDKKSDKKDDKPKDGPELDGEEVDVKEPTEGEMHEDCKCEGDVCTCGAESKPMGGPPMDAPAGDAPIISPPPSPNGPSFPDAKSPEPPMAGGPPAPGPAAPPLGAAPPTGEAPPIVMDTVGDAQKLIAILDMLMGKARDATTENRKLGIDIALKAPINGYRPSEGKENDLKLGYPQYPQGPTVIVAPSAEGATKAPKDPAKDMNDAKVNPMYPAGSDRMQDSAAGDKIDGKRPDGFFMRSSETLDKIIKGGGSGMWSPQLIGDVQVNPAANVGVGGATGFTGGTGDARTASSMGGVKQPEEKGLVGGLGGATVGGLTAGPLGVLTGGALGHGAEEMTAEKGIMGGLGGAALGGMAGGPLGAIAGGGLGNVAEEVATDKACMPPDDGRAQQTQQVIGQPPMQKPYGSGYGQPMMRHSQVYVAAHEVLMKAGFRDTEAHKVVNSTKGYEYVAHCTPCFNLMKAHKNWRFYSSMLCKAITTGAIPVRSLEPREENRFRNDVRLVKEALSKVNFSIAPDGGQSHPMGVRSLAKTGEWTPFVGTRGGQGARNVRTGQELYGEDAQRVLAGGGVPGGQEEQPQGQAPMGNPSTPMGQMGGMPVQPQPPSPAALGRFDNGSSVTEAQEGGIPVAPSAGAETGAQPGEPMGMGQSVIDEDAAALAEYEAAAGGLPLLGGPADDTTYGAELENLHGATSARDNPLAMSPQQQQRVQELGIPPVEEYDEPEPEGVPMTPEQVAEVESWDDGPNPDDIYESERDKRAVREAGY